MAYTAAQKRAYLCKTFAPRFKKGGDAYITEGVKDNTGPKLDFWLRGVGADFTPGPHKDPLPWCASFVSALAGWIDRKMKSGPTRKYNSRGSQTDGAGVFSTNVKDAVPGVVVSWKNDGATTGHVGLVIEVTSKGVWMVEGNTSKSVAPQNRNGYATARKFYSWSKLSRPASYRGFRAYVKLWPESNEELKKELPGGDFAEVEPIVAENIPTESQRVGNNLANSQKDGIQNSQSSGEGNMLADISLDKYSQEKGKSKEQEHIELYQIVKPNLNRVEKILT